MIALDPATGNEIWRFDAGVDRTGRYSEVTSRGVSAWRDSGAAPAAPCARRIFAGTIDARLLALDAATGRPCAAFGDGGDVRLAPGAGTEGPPDYQVTSPPAVVGDLVITGSSIGDNWHADTGSGVVRAFDARTGAERWRWSPLDGTGGTHRRRQRVVGHQRRRRPRSRVRAHRQPEPRLLRRPATRAPTRTPTRWSRCAPRPARSSWSFQTVHHDLWDYDLAAQPVLVDVPRDGRIVAAIAQPTKTGWLFVLDRETGTPLFDVEERPDAAERRPRGRRVAHAAGLAEAAAADAAGPADARHGVGSDRRPIARSAAGSSPSCARRASSRRPACRARSCIRATGPGTNWGSAAFAPPSSLLVLNTSRLATLVQLLPRDAYDRERAAATGDWEFGGQRETPVRHAADGSDRDRCAASRAIRRPGARSPP